MLYKSKLKGQLIDSHTKGIARSGDIRRGRRDEDEGMRRKGLIEKEMYGGAGTEMKRSGAAKCRSVLLPLTWVPPLFYD